MAHRTEVTSDGEPLFTESRSVQKRNKSTLSHSIPSQARDLLGLDKGEEVRIEIYDDGYFVTVAGEDGES